ncbi:VOC family protein [Rhodobacteraceae bacterium F11138]|nr:VOC family protein [Rhodobacteraceae bacterium F11138]
MSAPYRDLRYLRLPVPNLDAAAEYGCDILGLQLEDRSEDALYFRSDARNHSLCFTAGGSASVAITVGERADLDRVSDQLTAAGFAPHWMDDEAAEHRQVKTGITVPAPNGVTVEVVWRPLTSGWPFHGPRPTGITELQAVQLACTDVEANEAFWTNGIGGTVSDWAGQAAFINIDGAHHRIAIYPSARDGVLGVTFGVDSTDHIMRNWYFLQSRQLPVAHGPGRQPTSGAQFVSTKGVGDILYTYATAMEPPPPTGPRQFPDAALSHCSWGSPSTLAEFNGGTEHD